MPRKIPLGFRAKPGMGTRSYKYISARRPLRDCLRTTFPGDTSACGIAISEDSPLDGQLEGLRSWIASTTH